MSFPPAPPETHMYAHTARMCAFKERQIPWGRSWLLRIKASEIRFKFMFQRKNLNSAVLTLFLNRKDK